MPGPTKLAIQKKTFEEQRSRSRKRGPEHARGNTAPIQARADGTSASPTTPGQVGEIAERGVAGPGSSLPHLDRIQQAFGRHAVKHVQAYTGPAAQTATQMLSAHAFTRGSQVAFRETNPSLFVAAHEAAHVVQQRSGIQLKGGIGQVGDVYEQHADQVASAVVSGRSAESLLDQHAGPGSGGSRGLMQFKKVELPLAKAAVGFDHDAIMATLATTKTAITKDDAAPFGEVMSFSDSDFPHIGDNGVAEYTKLAKSKLYDKDAAMSKVTNGDFERHPLTEIESPGVEEWYLSPGGYSVTFVARDGAYGARGTTMVVNAMVKALNGEKIVESDPRHTGIHPDNIGGTHHHVYKTSPAPITPEELEKIPALVKAAKSTKRAK